MTPIPWGCSHFPGPQVMHGGFMDHPSSGEDHGQHPLLASVWVAAASTHSCLRPAEAEGLGTPGSEGAVAWQLAAGKPGGRLPDRWHVPRPCLGWALVAFKVRNSAFCSQPQFCCLK